MTVRPVSTARSHAKAVADESASAYQYAADAFAHARFDECKRYLRLCDRAPGIDGPRIQLLRARLARIEGDLETWYARLRQSDWAKRAKPSDISTSSKLRWKPALRPTPALPCTCSPRMPGKIAISHGPKS